MLWPKTKFSTIWCLIKRKKKKHLNLHESAFRHHNNSIMHSMEIENLFFFLAKMTSENNLDDNKQTKK